MLGIHRHGAILNEQECIFCRRSQGNFSVEDLIPIVLMGPAISKVIVTDAVCEECNNYFGRTIDSNFLNSDLIKLIRLRFRRFVSPENVPKLKREGIRNYIDHQGNVIKLDAVADNSGSRYMPSMKPQQQGKGKPVLFVRNYKEAIELERTLNERKRVKIEIEPFLPKPALQGPIEMPIDSRPPALDILYKMFIEFVYLHFGRQQAQAITFDPMRKLLLQPGSDLGSEYKYKMILNLPFDKLVEEMPKTKGAYHRIGIYRSPQFWCFFFNMFGEALFLCSLPPTEWYKQRIQTINL